MIRCKEGEYAKDRIPVTSSVMGIPARLKEISPTYFIMFNKATQKFEVHDSAQPDTSLACELPFDELDERTLSYVMEHHVSRLDQMVEEIDRYNTKLDADREHANMDKANYKMKQAYNYLKNNSKTDSIPKELINE